MYWIEYTLKRLLTRIMRRYLFLACSHERGVLLVHFLPFFSFNWRFFVFSVEARGSGGLSQLYGAEIFSGANGGGPRESKERISPWRLQLVRATARDNRIHERHDVEAPSRENA